VRPEVVRILCETGKQVLLALLVYLGRQLLVDQQQLLIQCCNSGVAGLYPSLVLAQFVLQLLDLGSLELHQALLAHTNTF
jgi:hypothetical protein